MTQAQLAKACGLTQSVVARIESKRARPQIDTLYKMLAALGCTLQVAGLTPYKRKKAPPSRSSREGASSFGGLCGGLGAAMGVCGGKIAGLGRLECDAALFVVALAEGKVEAAHHPVGRPGQAVFGAKYLDGVRHTRVCILCQKYPDGPPVGKGTAGLFGTHHPGSALSSVSNRHPPCFRCPNGKRGFPPFSMVADRNQDTQKVMTTPRRMTPVSITAASSDFPGPAFTPTKNMVIIAMRVGNRPLQGTKLLVRMAISRSLGESMIRQPTIPQRCIQSPYI